MDDPPEPLRKVEVPYREVTPPSEDGPRRTYEGAMYEGGVILGQDASQLRFMGCGFRRVTFRSMQLCVFEGCTFERCEWERSLANVLFKECRLLRPGFSSARLSGVDFRGGEMVGAEFSEGKTFEEVGLSNLRGLETSWRLHAVHVDPGPGLNRQIELDRGIEHAVPPWASRHASWTALRSFGKLPCFGVSYAGLVGVPAAVFLLSTFNEQAERLQAWGRLADGPLAALAARVQPIPVPSLNLALLLSLLLLAVASTVYAVACPARIKEFSYARWVDEFRRPAIHYLPLGWRGPWARGICAVCYPLGAFGVAAVLLWKAAGAAAYIVQHSPMPWMLK